MNKLLQTTLILAILSGSAMASTTYFPNKIEDGATVYVNADTAVNSVVDNYGVIGTELTSDYPTIRGEGTINNHITQSLAEITDTMEKTELAEKNIISGVTISKYHEIGERGGSVNENLTIDEVTVQEVVDTFADFKGLTNTDLVILSTNEGGKYVNIAGAVSGTATSIACHFGDTVTGLSDAYDLNLTGKLTLTGDLSNYKKGEINIKPGSGENAINLSAPGALNVPVNVTATSNIGGGSSACNIFKTVTVKDGTTLGFTGNVTLKKDAVLRLGAAPILE